MRKLNGKIVIEGLKLFGKHGVTEIERKRGQIFTVDVEMGLDLSAAAKSDELSDTVDYVRVVELIEMAFNSRRHQLLESLAAAISDVIIIEYHVSSLRVNVRKTDPPIKADVSSVGVVLER